ncbi:conserved hypothetical protein [uncultured Desulfobacterium sp.]|uniref:DUF3644 domain-containing protein n=1 Tax=uncultured Desulfobacterium sp. TaxID=201089 RepID=A0A445N476_9BACT|nr:conserved hypothetical protein [uncultured Desulfobacterium sp.]
MKARSKELVDRAIAATAAAIEIYNKPDFLYREETFAILAVAGWELILKAKWLTDHDNRVQSLYVYEPIIKKDGAKGKRQKVKLTRSGNPFTHSIDYLAKKLLESKTLDDMVWRNIQALLEMRDTSVHFYNRGNAFSLRLQEIGAASLRNFVVLVGEWFERDLSDFNFYLMPLAFIAPPACSKAILLNSEEKNFLRFIDTLESVGTQNNGRFSVTINVEVTFTRSKAKDALDVRLSKNPNAREIRFTEEQIKDRYPWDYNTLTKEWVVSI